MEWKSRVGRGEKMGGWSEKGKLLVYAEHEARNNCKMWGASEKCRMRWRKAIQIEQKKVAMVAGEAIEISFGDCVWFLKEMKNMEIKKNEQKP